MSHPVLDDESLAVTDQERSTLAKVEDLLSDLDLKSRPERPWLVSSEGEEIELPELVWHLMHQVVTELAQGNSVTVVPIHQVLTTQEAADILNVSRQYLVELLDAEAIAFTKVGTHRRLRLSDLMAYKQQRDATRREGLSRLTKTSQKLGLYGKSFKAQQCQSKSDTSNEV